MENTSANNKKGMTRETQRTLFIIGMLALPVLQYLVFFVYVNIDTILMAFQFRTTTSVTWGFENFERFFQMLSDPTKGVTMAIRNSVLVGLNDFLLLTISVVFAYFFYKKVRGAAVFKFIFFLPSIISMVIYITAYKYMLNPTLGIVPAIMEAFGAEPPMFLANDSEFLLPLVMIYCLWVGTGYNILIMGGAMGNLPEDVMEYSRLEGVNYFDELFKIVIPMIWPTISVGILTSITTMFTLYLQVDLLTGTGGTDKQAVTIGFMINSVVKTGADLEWAACMGICFTVVAIPIITVVRIVLDKVGKSFEE